MRQHSVVTLYPDLQLTTMNFRARNLPRHSSFEYKPRFYDPDKERFEAMKVDYNTTEDVGSALKSQISQGFRGGGRVSRINFRTERSVATAASNKRLVIIIFAMAAIAYLLLESNVEGLLAALVGKQ